MSLVKLVENVHQTRISVFLAKMDFSRPLILFLLVQLVWMDVTSVLQPQTARNAFLITYLTQAKTNVLTVGRIARLVALMEFVWFVQMDFTSTVIKSANNVWISFVTFVPLLTFVSAARMATTIIPVLSVVSSAPMFSISVILVAIKTPV